MGWMDLVLLGNYNISYECVLCDTHITLIKYAWECLLLFLFNNLIHLADLQGVHTWVDELHDANKLLRVLPFTFPL